MQKRQIKSNVKRAGAPAKTLLQISSDLEVSPTADGGSDRVTPVTMGHPVDQLARHLPSNEQLVEMFGVRSEQGATGLTGAAVMGVGKTGNAFRDFVLSMGRELEPRDAIEAMLVTQIALAHVGYANAMGGFWDAESDQAREAYSRMALRFSNGMISQFDALRRHRAGGSTNITVGQVTVQDGGQAIVGSVQSESH
jgi:hypothetical protein